MTEQPTAQVSDKTPESNAGSSDITPVVDPDILLGDSPVETYEPVASVGLLTPTSVELAIVRRDRQRNC